MSSESAKSESTTSSILPIKVYLAFQDKRAHVAGIMNLVNDPNVTFVSDESQADLIIFTNPANLPKGYKSGKYYAFYQTSRAFGAPPLPEKGRIIRDLSQRETLLAIADASHKRPFGAEAAEAKRENEEKSEEKKKKEPKKRKEVVLNLKVEEPIKPAANALNILVVDWLPKNIDAAKRDLSGHHLITATSYPQAMEKLTAVSYDVVLTSLYTSRTKTAYGVPIVFEAIRRKCSKVALLIESPEDGFSGALDYFRLVPFNCERTLLRIFEPKREDYIINWFEALERLMHK